MPEDCDIIDCGGEDERRCTPIYDYDVGGALPNPPSHETQTITLTVDPAASGTVTGAGTWTKNTFITIKATPATGYQFSSWSGDFEGTSATAQVFMDEDKTVVANFVLISYFVTLSQNPQGSATLTGGGAYSYGDTATITAIPLGYFEFDSWSGDISSINNPENVLIDGSKNITANLSLPQYSLTVNINPADGGSASGAGTYTAGTVVPLTATPSEDGVFLNWTGDITSADNPESILMDGNKSVTANFLVCGCANANYQLFLYGTPSSSTVVKVVDLSPNPPVAGYTRRRGCVKFVCACIGENQEVLSATQYGGPTTTGVDLTTRIWTDIGIPVNPGTYVYRFDFSGWRRSTRGSPATKRPFISSDTSYTISEEVFPGIN